MKNFISNLSKRGIVSMLLAVVVMAFGATPFAMAIDPVELAPDPNPSDEANGGIHARPAGEKPTEDLAGLKTQLNGKSATATDVRDAGLAAEDFDEKVVYFKKFKYVSDAILMSRVKAIKVNEPIVSHFRVGQPDIDATYIGAGETITAGQETLTLAKNDFLNPDALTECSVVILPEVDGYGLDKGGNAIAKGALQLFVLNAADTSESIVFRISNPPIGDGKTVSIAANQKFLVCAPAASESQMRVAPVTFLPEKVSAVLQKKIGTCYMTDAFKEQLKKTPLGKEDVIRNATDIFKRKCARSNWLGAEDHTQVKVKELNGNREDTFMQQGIIPQVPSMYTHGEELNGDDFMAMSSMMFTQFAQSDEATMFVGKREMKRIMKYVNSAQINKDVATVDVNEFGIRVRKYTDGFGSFEIVYDPTLDEIGYTDYAVILDLSSMVRYYMREDKVQTQDMKKTAEAREAEAWNISRIDCFCLRGGNALLVCPSSAASKAAKLGGITSHFVSVAALTGALDKTKKYFLTAASEGFAANTLVEWDKDLNDWVQFEGRIFA